MRCHLFWQHKNPLEFTEWFEKKYPARYLYLMENRNKIIKRTKEDYEEIFKNILKKNIKGLVFFPY
jgi:hypothetical protein